MCWGSTVSLTLKCHSKSLIYAQLLFSNPTDYNRFIVFFRVSSKTHLLFKLDFKAYCQIFIYSWISFLNALTTKFASMNTLGLITFLCYDFLQLTSYRKVITYHCSLCSHSK